MSPAPSDPATARAVAFFERIAPEDVARLDAIYAADAYFRDPFNEVRGLPAIARIYGDMFARLADCRFEIRDALAEGRAAFLTWDFRFRIRSWRPSIGQRIHGATHLRFDAAGRIAYHRDYWDAADELYAKLPVIGGVMRALKRYLA